MVKYSLASEEDLDLTPKSVRSLGGRDGNPLKYSCLENHMTEDPDGLWYIGLHGV